MAISDTYKEVKTLLSLGKEKALYAALESRLRLELGRPADPNHAQSLVRTLQEAGPGSATATTRAGFARLSWIR